MPFRLIRIIWREAGWDDSTGVTRVEFQHRGTFLDEVGLRDASTLASKLDEVWQLEQHYTPRYDFQGISSDAEMQQIMARIPQFSTAS